MADVPEIRDASGAVALMVDAAFLGEVAACLWYMADRAGQRAPASTEEHRKFDCEHRRAYTIAESIGQMLGTESVQTAWQEVRKAALRDATLAEAVRLVSEGMSREAAMTRAALSLSKDCAYLVAKLSGAAQRGYTDASIDPIR